MIDIQFFKFMKKPNSTAKPSGVGYSLSCDLIENTNILAPKIRVNAPIDFLSYEYNYIYIPIFGRYYYINDPSWELGTWTYSCTCDVLATYKTLIGSSTEYVLRSASQFDGDIIDTAYITKTSEYVRDVYPEENETYQEPDTIYGPRPAMCYIVGIIGGLPTSVLPNIPSGKTPFCGTVVYYVLMENQLRQLIDMILVSVDAYNVPSEELSKPLQQQLINPLQYIHSIKAMPTIPNMLNTEVTFVKLGFTELDIPYSDPDEPNVPYLGGWHIMCSEDITDPQPTHDTGRGYLFSHRCDIHLPLHPAYTDKGHFVCGAPYSKYVFHVEPFGDIELASGDILSSMITYEEDPVTEQREYFINMHCDTLIDFVTGDARLHLWALSATGIVTFAIDTKNISVDVPYHQTIQDIMGFRQAMRGVEHNMYSSFLNIGSGVIGGALSFGAADASKSLQGTYMMGASGVRQGSGAINSMLNGIQQGKAYVDSATSANQVSVSGSNTVGSFMAFCRDLCTPVVHCYYTQMVDEYREDIGRPLMSPRRIDTLSGYILCEHSHFQSYGTYDENRMVESFMDGGFYYE